MPATEQLTQAERDKQEIDPDIDFREIATRPFDELSPNLIGMFKWSGVYHQLQKGFFMIRLRVPGGVLTAPQLRRAGELCKEYAQDQLGITTRQCLQFHWVRQQDIYKVIEGMRAVGVLTSNACGDVCRNVVGCPGQGTCPHEIGDTGAMLRRVADDPELLQEQRNLPRKHKINIVGCGRACGMELMNCQGFHPVVRKTSTGTEERGWEFLAGGGLGQLPHMGQRIFEWVPEDLVPAVAKAGVEAHNRYGDRRRRKYARMKIIVADRGAAGFADLLLELLRERGVDGLDRIEVSGDRAAAIGPIPFEGETVISESDADRSTVRIMIPRGDFSSTEAIRFATWSASRGNGTVMLTQRQNLRLPGVPADQVESLVAEIRAAGYCLDGFEHLPDVVACVGTTMCNLAVSDTPRTRARIVEELAGDRDFWKQVGPLRINMNGCPNSCGHHWIADIGLRGRRFRGKGGSEEGFTITVGGRLDGAGRIGETLVETPADEVVPVLRAILQLYLDERTTAAERFGDFVERVGVEAMRHQLAALEPHEADEPTNARNLELQDLFRRAINEIKDDKNGN